MAKPLFWIIGIFASCLVFPSLGYALRADTLNLQSGFFATIRLWI